jgi:CRISPR system Cascade subunit CasD
MSDSRNWLALYLDAPMQSWGYQSHFDRRTSLPYPTKSGIIGMICAAMGIKRDDRSMIRQLVDLKMRIYVFSTIRRITDYHTVGGGYDPRAERYWMPRKADGSVPKPVVTYRDYLLEGKFGVLLHGDGALLEHCKEALANPKWGVWLGRKSCIPSSFICHGRFPSEKEALKHLEGISGKKAVRRVTEVARFEDGTDTLPDIPIDFSNRDFSFRRIADEHL